MRPKTVMELLDSLHRFVERSSSDLMPDAASELIELLEADAVEPLQTPGRVISAEEVAERLEQRLDRMRRRDEEVDGLELIEEAVGHLRMHDREDVAPWTFEDGEGIRWFVLAGESDVIACYTSRPFVETDI